MPTGACSSGYHDGGDGECTSAGACSANYHDGGTGTCVPLVACSSGYHDDGTGVCVLDGDCASGYHDGGDGRCVTLAKCSAGYHDGGDGTCIAASGCLYGYRDDGTGKCVCDPYMSGLPVTACEGLKGSPEDQIVVAGIFGWPLSDADYQVAQYKIAPVPNPNTADTQHTTVYDYWPICYDPDHMPTSGNTDAATGFDATAAGLAARGGLRESAFIDEFGTNGLKFSACEREYGTALTAIGAAMASQIQTLCVTDKLYDTDQSSGNGLQPDCTAYYAVPQPDPRDSTKIIYVKSEPALPQCEASYSASNPPPDSVGDCWRVASDATACKSGGLLVTVLRTAAHLNAGPLIPGTRLDMLCRTCHDSTVAGCSY